MTTNKAQIKNTTTPTNTPAKSTSKPQTKPQKNNLIKHKDFFEKKASDPLSSTQKLAVLILKMTPDQPSSTETREEFLTNLKDVIISYDDLTEKLKELSIQVSQLRNENLQITNQKPKEQVITTNYPNFLENFPKKETFEVIASSPPSTLQKLASCLLKAPFTSDIQNEFLTALEGTIGHYESMGRDLQDLSMQISELRNENLKLKRMTGDYQNSILEGPTDCLIVIDQESLHPKRARKELLLEVQGLTEEIADLYTSLDIQLKNLYKEKEDFSASMCLNSQKKWNTPREQLDLQTKRLSIYTKLIEKHTELMKDEINEIEKKLESKNPPAESQKIPVVASLSLVYLDTKKLSDSLTFLYHLAQHQIKAAEWKLKYIYFVDTVFAEIAQLAMDVGSLKSKVDDAKYRFAKQAVQVENGLKSDILPKYKDLANRTKQSSVHIDELRRNIENKLQRDTLKTIDIYDIQTKLVLSQEIEKILTNMQTEQQNAYDKINAKWATIEENMGSDCRIPALKNRWFGSPKSIAYELNRILTAIDGGYATLPLDSTEGSTWQLKRKVVSPFDPTFDSTSDSSKT
ncbi:MAG TPA: hypothetical protein VIH61_09945 [Waddliaceae bacterium]